MTASSVHAARGSHRPRVLARTVTALLVTVALGFLVPVAASGEDADGTPAPPDWRAYATEELTVRLLPFLPDATELPAGYRLGPIQVATSWGLALRLAPPGEDPRAALARLPGLPGLPVLPVLQIAWVLVPEGPNDPAAPSVAVSASVMRDPAAAAFVSPRTRPPAAVRSLDAGDGLGEARDAFVEPRIASGRPPGETLSWR